MNIKDFKSGAVVFNESGILVEMDDKEELFNEINYYFEDRNKLPTIFKAEKVTQYFNAKEMISDYVESNFNEYDGHFDDVIEAFDESVYQEIQTIIDKVVDNNNLHYYDITEEIKYKRSDLNERTN